jgi:hypothetical protein
MDVGPEPSGSSRAALNPQWPISLFLTSCAAARAVLFGSRATGVRRGAPIRVSIALMVGRSNARPYSMACRNPNAIAFRSSKAQSCLTCWHAPIHLGERGPRFMGCQRG